MEKSFFGLDTALSNVNDDEIEGCSEEEYDALNDETFGYEDDDLDWEHEHEQMAQITESARHHQDTPQNSHLNLEASLSQLVLDDEVGSKPKPPSVWPQQPVPVSALKNVCTVQELERSLRQQKQPHNVSQPQNMFEPRFPPVILQRPPGLQGPVPLPFAPNQAMNPNIQQMQSNQQLNQFFSQTGQLGPTNQIGQGQIVGNNQMGPHQANHMGPMQPTQMGPMQPNQIQNNQINQIGGPIMPPGFNQNMPNNQLGQPPIMNNQLGQNHQMMPNNQMINNTMGPNSNIMHMNQNVNQNHMGNQMLQGNQLMGMNQNQMMNGNQFGPMSNQMMPVMQPRMIPPPPGMGQRPNFNPNMGFNPNFHKPNIDQQGMMHPSMMGQNQQFNQNQMINQNQVIPMMSQNQQNQPMGIQKPIQQPIGTQLMTNQGQMQNHPGAQNHPIGSQNHQIGSQNHPIGSQNQIAGSQMQPMGSRNQPMGSQNQPIGSQNQSMGLLNQSIGSQNQHIGSHNQQIGSQNQPGGSQNQLLGSQNQPINSQNQKPQIIQQKARIQNNINQNKITSQSLVQFIQNTHPMLNFNNGLHNASHHPLLNSKMNVLNTQTFHNSMYRNGGLENNRFMNGEDLASSVAETDEYAGLMSQREKQWLLNIQMLQLNTGTPYIDDYYYTVFLDRQSKKEKEGVKEAHKANQQNHPFYSGGVKQERERHNSGRHNSCSEDQPTPRTYVPTQFENSLGKLQCGSVTAPRKIIDVDVVQAEASVLPSGKPSRAPSVASTQHPSEMIPREIRRTKQLLIDIEAIYNILLTLEELTEPLAIENALVLKEREEKQRLARKWTEELKIEVNEFLRNIESVRSKNGKGERCDIADKRQVVAVSPPVAPPARNLLDEDKDEMVNRIFAGILFEDRLQQFLTVRKGKLLLCRFLKRVPANHSRLRATWNRILRSLPTAARKDREDKILPSFAPFFKQYISSSSGWSACLEACACLSEAVDPSRTPHALSTPLTLSCVCTLAERAFTLVNTPDATANERQWTKFLKTLAKTLKINHTVTVARPVEPLSEAQTHYHFKLLESRTVVEILPRGKSAAELNDLTKSEISQLLIKHLC